MGNKYRNLPERNRLICSHEGIDNCQSLMCSLFFFFFLTLKNDFLMLQFQKSVCWGRYLGFGCRQMSGERMWWEELSWRPFQGSGSQEPSFLLLVPQRLTSSAELSASIACEMPLSYKEFLKFFWHGCMFVHACSMHTLMYVYIRILAWMWI